MAALPIDHAFPARRVEGLWMTMIGQATLLIQAAGLNVLTDPVWSDRASPTQLAGPKRSPLPVSPSPICRDRCRADVPQPPRHLDLAALNWLQATFNPLIVVPLGNDTLVRRTITNARILAGDWADGVPIGDGAATYVVRANHSLELVPARWSRAARSGSTWAAVAAVDDRAFTH